VKQNKTSIHYYPKKMFKKAGIHPIQQKASLDKETGLSHPEATVRYSLFECVKKSL